MSEAPLYTLTSRPYAFVLLIPLGLARPSHNTSRYRTCEIHTKQRLEGAKLIPEDDTENAKLIPNLFLCCST